MKRVTTILVFNAGNSSLKFGVFRVDGRHCQLDCRTVLA
jgi:acetate kinase